MNILHDKSSVKSFSAKWIDRGYAREDVHSLRLQYVYTPEQREANRQICDAGPDEAHRRIKQAAESKKRCDGLCHGGHCQGVYLLSV